MLYQQRFLAELDQLKRHLRNVLMLATLFLPVVSVLFSASSAHAQSVKPNRDCSENSVIVCGALSVGELQTDYLGEKGVQDIFAHFGINQTDIKNMSTTAVVGEVTNTGQVLVNGKIVADNALTAGRQDIPGSQRMITQDGTTIFVRPPSVSFASSPLSAFVVMRSNGQFNFAILTSCGNPVSATPTTKAVVSKTTKTTNNTTKTQTVVVQPAPPAPTPPPNITVVVPPPPPATPTTVVQPVASPAPAPQQIPNTGTGDIIGFGAFVTLAAGGTHYLFRRLKLKA